MNLTTLTICALATYRLTRLITVEEGPFRLAQRLRNIADPDQKTWIGRGMACPWCLSFWLGPLAIYAATYPTGLLLVSGLAVSALVGLGYQCSGYVLSTLERLTRRAR